MTEPNSSSKQIPPDEHAAHGDHMFRTNREYRDAYTAAKQIHGLIDALVGLRKQQGITQIDMARLMGVKQPTVSGFENESSDPKLSTLQRYSRALNANLKISVSHPLLPAQVPDSADDLPEMRGDVATPKPVHFAGASRSETVTKRLWSFEITDPAVVEALSGGRRQHLNLAITATTKSGRTVIEGRIPLRVAPSGARTVAIVLRFEGVEADVSLELVSHTDSATSRDHAMTGLTESDIDLSAVTTDPQLTLTLH